MEMRSLYQKYFGAVDVDRLMKNTEALYQLELGQTFSCYHASAAKALELLQQTGIPNAERIPFPADGKTAYQDKISPLGWEASTGRLIIREGFAIPENFVAADYQRHPFHLIKGSCGTAPEGEEVRIISDEQLLSGADPHNALVLCPLGGGARTDYLGRMFDLGVRGFINDWSMNAEEAPDELQWCNAFTERSNWHVNLDDRPFIGFCVTPRTGRMLRAAVSRGGVTAFIQSDARRLPDETVDVVTAMIPGKSSREFWILAHLYEPLSNDNSSGVAAAIETARLMMQEEKPEFSLRVIFGLEYYGFAAYASSRGTCLTDQVIGACDYDAMYLRKGWDINLRCAGPASPFFGNYLLKVLADELTGLPGMPPLHFLNSFECMYDDDSALSDPQIGIPTVWPIRTGPNFWHNSSQTMAYIHPREFARGTAIHTALVHEILHPRKELPERSLQAAAEELAAEIPLTVGSAAEHLARRYEILRQDLKDWEKCFPEEMIDPRLKKFQELYEVLKQNPDTELPASPWRDYAAQIIPMRLKTGMPHDLADVKPEDRIPLPDSVLYGPLAAILADMDGKNDLGSIIRMVEHETRRLMPEAEIRKMIRAVLYLNRHGYVRISHLKEITREEIVQALKNCGVRPGDCLLIHSALGEFGSVAGGAGTVVQAFLDVVGEDGTLLFPAFTYPYVFMGNPMPNTLYSPFDPKNLKQIWTGALPRFVLKNYPEAVRSAHITHSWCALGRMAAEACAAQQPDDPPMGLSSPMEFALQKHGRLIHFGSAVTETTFLHLLEDRLNLPGLEDAFCKVLTENGGEKFVTVPRNVPGDRTFYRGTLESIGFFREAMKRGLEVRRTSLGMGKILCMDLEQLDRLGREILSENPLLLVSDGKTGVSCRNLIRKYRQRS